ncbi:hypothetical protein LMG33810_001328 [Carnimonas sp. LMG 33810]
MRRTTQDIQTQTNEFSELDNQQVRAKSAALIATDTWASAFTIGSLTSIAEDINDITASLHMASNSNREFQTTDKSLLKPARILIRHFTPIGIATKANADLTTYQASRR